MESGRCLESLSDDELLRRLGELVSHSRRVEADLVAHIGEVDERRLYAREACPSMFVYCTKRLHLSEAEAYLRIAVARAAREHPVLLAMLREGRLHLTGIAKLLPLLTRENREALLQRATHRSKRQIEELVAELAPRPDAPSVMRRLPGRRTAPIPGVTAGTGSTGTHAMDSALGMGSVKRRLVELRPDGVAPSAPLTQPPTPLFAVPQSPTPCLATSGAPTPPLAPVPALTPAVASPSTRASLPTCRALVAPLSPARYKVQFTASVELHDKLERLQALMRSQVPDGDLAAIIEQAVTEKLERLEARRYAKTSAPRKGLAEANTSPSSRQIPAAVRRAVRERDGNRCGFVDERGGRCPERDRLEFHHRHPFAVGGDHSPQNIGLLCRAHNTYLAERDYGKAAMRLHLGSGKETPVRPAVVSPRAPSTSPAPR